MPKIRICPRYKEHKPTIPYHYKTPNHKRFVEYRPSDRMYRLYSRYQDSDGKNYLIRTQYWYCKECDLVIHEDYSYKDKDIHFLIGKNVF